jgi:ParB-like chromosome segregation protein Spo0J
VQNAEDARAIAVKRQNEDLLASERSAAADRELRAENGRTAAQAEAERIKRDTEAQRVAAKTEADRLKVENDAKMLATQGELDRAAQSTAKAEAEKKELRATLLLQFNAILQTRDTPRGLVVNPGTPDCAARLSGRTGHEARLTPWQAMIMRADASRIGASNQ